MRVTPHTPIHLIAALAAAGCSAPSQPQATVTSESGGVFPYLLERYDDDGDGRIAPLEYDRAGVEFTRLDRVPDGYLTEADFASTGRRMRALPPDEARGLRSVALMAWYLQADDDPRRLDLSELGAAFLAYDANADGRVGRTEFEARAPSRGSHGHQPTGRSSGLLEPETTDVWERLADAPDQNDDGFLTEPELAAFSVQARPAGVWHADQAPAAYPGGPPEGSPAPDFVLQPPDGGPAMRLSSFAGDKPVALIFGSYT